MSNASVVEIESGHQLGERMAHEVVAAQLRGEAKAREEDPKVVVASIAREIEDLGLVPDVEELRQRYAGPADVPASLTARRTSP